MNQRYGGISLAGLVHLELVSLAYLHRFFYLKTISLLKLQ